MASLGDIFSLSVRYRDQDLKVFENQYFYSFISATGGAPATASYELATAFMSDILPVIRAGQPTAFTFQEIVAYNLFDLADAYAVAISLPGTRGTPGTGGELMPTFNAVKITAATSNGLVRKGRKMFSGLFEADQAAGLLTAIGVPYWAALAAAYVADAIYDDFANDLTWRPCVVKRVRSGTAGNYEYRLPETALEAVYGYIQSAVYSAVVTTQNSRKD